MQPSSSRKRLMDLAIAVPALILTAPVQAAAAIGIALTLGRPILFKQRRPGLHGEPFQMRKFRTMRPIDPSLGLITDASRLTKFGQFLRSTSIDELPTLWNIIRSEMSLVGPRPLLMEYLDRYTPEQARRMEVKPGLTGLAQITGRNAQSWEQRFSLDLRYVDNQSTKLDVIILLKTLKTVLKREGITGDGHATMAKFNGPSSSEPNPE